MAIFFVIGAKTIKPNRKTFMETTRKTSAKKSTTSIKKKIVAAYKESVLMTGHSPVSIYSFCKENGLEEEDFYSSFGSFQGLERRIWRDLMDTTISRLTQDKTFTGFSAREKVLALCYTLMEELLKDRSYVIFKLNTIGRLDIVPPFLRDFRERYSEFMASIISEGQESGEIAKRPYLDQRYPQLFWIHLVQFLQYWKDDDSPAFEKTDAYVEKSVRLAFDLIGKGALDSAMDFARFMLQSRFK